MHLSFLDFGRAAWRVFLQRQNNPFRLARPRVLTMCSSSGRRAAEGHAPGGRPAGDLDEAGGRHGIVLRHCAKAVPILAALGLLLAMDAQSEINAPGAPAYFETRVRPLFIDKCVRCHGADKQKNNLRLDTREGMLTGGDGGPAVIPHDSAESLVMKAVRYEDLEMPPDDPLSTEEIAHLTNWIDAGAPWPDHDAPLRTTASPSFNEDDRAWWAFQPVVMPDIPVTEGDNWSDNPIDQFVYSRLADENLKPAPRASRINLVRRLYFDLVGLPPTPEEIAAFLADESAEPWENLVDQLLDDPRYGEHWGRFWLDLVRYAESDGWNKDSYRPDIWRYRDYVVKSFNDDKPYPGFVREQLAGDEISGDDPANRVATGFLRLGIYEYNQRDARGQWNDTMNEITDVTADVFLGMSVSCSRCHDHKFDPIPQTDYYGLRAFFEPLIWRDDLPAATKVDQAAWREKQDAWDGTAADVNARIDALCEPYYARKWKDTIDKFPLEIQDCFYKPVEERNSWEDQMAYLVARQFYEEGTPALKSMSKEDEAQLASLEEERAAFDALKPAPLPKTMCVTDFPGDPSPTFVPGKDDAPVTPHFLSILSDVAPAIPDLPGSTGRRTALAEWITREDNPLTTRLIVNRVWQQHFGVGLVSTASDFGRLGQPPTHPDLLDWLTANYIANGWSMKYLHRMILLSATWRQSTEHPRAADCLVKDPGEQLLWRSRARRLTAEGVRDAMLSASGELDSTVGGASVKSEVPRRALYVQSFRNAPNALLQAFDATSGLTSVAQRSRTITPTQALLMLNGEYTLERAGKLADRVLDMNPDNMDEALSVALMLTWGRSPSPEELSQARDFVDVENGETTSRDRVVDFCHVLLNSNEFLHID